MFVRVQRPAFDCHIDSEVLRVAHSPHLPVPLLRAPLVLHEAEVAVSDSSNNHDGTVHGMKYPGYAWIVYRCSWDTQIVLSSSVPFLVTTNTNTSSLCEGPCVLCGGHAVNIFPICRFLPTSLEGDIWGFCNILLYEVMFCFCQRCILIFPLLLQCVVDIY